MPPNTPTDSWLKATGAAEDIARMEAKALAALVPAMAQAQKELSADLAKWYAKLGPNAHNEKFTVAQLRQVQLLLGVAEAKVQTIQKGYPHASFPMVAAQAVQNVMNVQQPHKLAAQTLEGQLEMLKAKFKDLPSPQLIEAALIAKGDHLVLNQFKNSAQRYAGQVHQDLKLQFGVGLAKGETIQQMTKRIAGLSNFQKAVDASHPTAAGGAVAGALTKRYNMWAQRLVRTELAGAYNKVAADGIKLAHDLDDRIMMMWDATNDMRVCPECRALHGTKIKPGGNGFFKGGHRYPPAHPNCRCSVVSWMDEWADESVPQVPTVEEVEAKEKQAQQQQDEGGRRAHASEAAKAAAKEDLATYEGHKQKQASDQMAAQKAAAAAKAAKEEAEYQAMLAAQKAAAEKVAKKAAEDAKKAQKAALAAMKPAPFDPATSPIAGDYYKGKAAGQKKLFDKGGFALKDKDTIVGHGMTFNWDKDSQQWMKTGSPTGYAYSWSKKTWVPTTPAPAVVPQKVVTAPKLFAGPKPADIVGFEWKEVNGTWVLHKGDLPTTALVPKYSLKSPMLLDEYSLGADIAKYGLVPTKYGVMEGHGYKFVKNPNTGTWEKTMSVNTPYTAPSKAHTPAPKQASTHAPAAPAVAAWTPQRITLAANRKGVTDFNAHPSEQYAGFHGKAFSQDGDVVEGGSVRVLKVTGVDGKDYYEAQFKVTHPYGEAAKGYGTGERGSWAFNYRHPANYDYGYRGVLKDGRSGSESVPCKTRIHTEKGHTLELGTSGAFKNHVRIRANSLADLNKAMDRFGEHMGADLRRPPIKDDLILQAKARIAAKYDPAEFGRLMSGYGGTADQQRENIERAYKRTITLHPNAKNHLEDMKEVEVYPGHKTLFSKSLGQQVAAEFPTMTHTGSAQADVCAKIIGDTGLMSSMKRYGSGVFTSGMSTHEDFNTGGADGVFMRLNPAKSHTDTDYSTFKIILDTEQVMGRMDWWSFNHDNYGRAEYASYRERWSVPEMRKGHESSGNEVMAPHGVPPSAIKYVVVRDETYRKEVLAQLQSQGIKQINGKPIEDVVRVQGK